MDEKTYTITLADGTQIDGLALNGNNYISKAAIDPSVFTGNCSPVAISDGLASELHHNMEFVQITEVSGDYWFVLRDISTEELTNIKMQSDIEYVAMMAGVEL